MRAVTQMKPAYVLLLLCVAIVCVACQPPSDTAARICFGADIEGQFIEIGTGGLDINRSVHGDAQASGIDLAPFAIQVHEVTNRQFAQFIEATGYMTDAERVITPNQGGSAVFTPPSEQTDGRWSLSKSASWRQPEANIQALVDRPFHPVVHVSLNDARAYAKWVGGRLPSEAEWQYIAQWGLPDRRVSTSGAYDQDNLPIANTWQGVFPIRDTGADGFRSTAPVACYEPSQIGLYDVIGNVWEWTSTPALASNPDAYIIKGGSYLCAENYCRRYRPAARQVQEANFSTSHIGFRVVK